MSSRNRAAREYMARERGPAIRRIVRSRGFTLIELVIVVLIVAILAAIAYPSYTNYITSTRRSAAEACLAEYSNYMERYYTTNLSYETPATPTSTGSGSPSRITLPTLDCEATTQTGDYYTYQFPTTSASVTTSTYTIQAVPQGIQASRDAKCGTLSLDNTGTRSATGTSGTTSCWKH